MLLKVKDEKNLVRDDGSNAILNNDMNGLERYYQEKAIKLVEIEKKRRVEEEINTLKEDVKEIKNLLAKLAEKLNV